MLADAHRALLRQLAWTYLRYNRHATAEPLYALLLTLDTTDHQARMGFVYARLCQGSTEGVGTELAQLRAVAETPADHSAIARLEARRLEVAARTPVEAVSTSESPTPSQSPSVSTGESPSLSPDRQEFAGTPAPV